MKKLREELLKVRGSLSKEEARTKSEEMVKKALQFKPFTNSNKILFYHPKGKEADLTELMNFSLKENKSVFLPKISSVNASMKIHKIKDLNSELELGEYGIKVPKQGCPEFPNHRLDLVLVPGVAFDLAGNRLGQGGGHYDRFLKGLASLKVGVAYEFQIVKALKAEEWDIPMDYILTEKRIIKINREQQRDPE